MQGRVMTGPLSARMAARRAAAGQAGAQAGLAALAPCAHRRPAVAQLGTYTGMRRANAVDTAGARQAASGRCLSAAVARPAGRGRRAPTRMMFERFTEKAIKVVMLAQEEARRLGHNFVGTEQILLGLIGESTGIAAKVLKSMGVNLKDARIEVEKIIGRGSGFVAVEIPFTPRAKRVLELSLEEARHLGAHPLQPEASRFARPLRCARAPAPGPQSTARLQQEHPGRRRTALQGCAPWCSACLCLGGACGLLSSWAGARCPGGGWCPV